MDIVYTCITWQSYFYNHYGFSLYSKYIEQFKLTTEAIYMQQNDSFMCKFDDAFVLNVFISCMPYI